MEDREVVRARGVIVGAFASDEVIDKAKSMGAVGKFIDYTYWLVFPTPEDKAMFNEWRESRIKREEYLLMPYKKHKGEPMQDAFPLSS